MEVGNPLFREEKGLSRVQRRVPFYHASWQTVWRQAAYEPNMTPSSWDGVERSEKGNGRKVLIFLYVVYVLSYKIKICPKHLMRI